MSYRVISQKYEKLTKIQKCQSKTARCSEYHTKRFEMFIKYAQMTYAKLWTPCEKERKNECFKMQNCHFWEKDWKNATINHITRVRKMNLTDKITFIFCVCFFYRKWMVKKSLLHHKTRRNSSLCLICSWFCDIMVKHVRRTK